MNTLFLFYYAQNDEGGRMGEIEVNRNGLLRKCLLMG